MTQLSNEQVSWQSFGLVGKRVVVTGGCAGIGSAIVERLLLCGASVIVIDTDEEALLRLCAQKPDVLAIRGDASVASEIEDIFKQVSPDGESIWGLVNNAARFLMKGLDASPSEWTQITSANLVGPMLCCAAAKPFMHQFGGSIVNLCSISAVLAQKSFLTYNASKGALLTATKCLALDLASVKIRVNAVSPGSIWTESNETFIKQNFGLNRAGADSAANLGGRHLLNRMGDPVEVANVVIFLLSPLSSFVTGSNYFVDGGYSAV